MRIADGQAEDHPTPLPLDASATPAVQVPTARFPGGAEQGAVASVSYAEQVAAGEAAAQAAMSAGHAAELGRRQGYETGMLPLGTVSHGDAMVLPEVPANVIPPADSNLYPWSGMQPVTASAAVDNYPQQ